MSRILFGPGAKGFLVEQIQQALLQAGFDPHRIDGDYGKNTAATVLSFQRSYNTRFDQSRVPEDGIMDDLTWDALLARPIPSTWERALQLTASFEGHGFTLAAGNYDGAWLTWGIIGFTMKSGNLPRIIRNVNATAPECITGAFGEKAQELSNIIKASDADKEAWANRISTAGGRRLVEPWNSAFDRFGRYPAVQKVQLDLAYGTYFVGAIQAASKQGLKSELGLALMFDIHVQNGRVNDRAQAAIDRKTAETPPANEMELRSIIANAVADSASVKWAENVRRRKLTIATGQGTVNQRNYVLERWALGEFDALELAQTAAAGGGNP